MVEIFVIVGGAYALYVCGVAIATNLDYWEVNKRDQVYFQSVLYPNRFQHSHQCN